MIVRDALSESEIETRLLDMPGWKLHEDALVKRFTFPSFMSAIGFMSNAGPAIDALNHHPEWTNVYNRVDVRLTSHDAGNRVTAADLTLAELLDRTAGTPAK